MTILSKLVRASLAGAVVLAASSVGRAETAAKPSTSTLPVAPGNQVSIEYTLTDEKGAEIQSNKGETPITYVVGKSEILPGLEKALSGMHAGDEKDVKLPPEEAYGPVRKEAIQEVPKDKIPPEALKVGTILRAQSPDGQTGMARVSEVKDKTVIVDLNHPLAGKTLAFHVKVLDVKKAEAKGPEAKPEAAAAPPAPPAGDAAAKGVEKTTP